MAPLPQERAREILKRGQSSRILVIGDVMLDRFIAGTVHRISPEAPVPVLNFKSENLMPGGAANVARNLTALGAPTALYSLVGKDPEADQLRSLLQSEAVKCRGLRRLTQRTTGTKTRIVAQQQQIVRVDREIISPLTESEQRMLEKEILKDLDSAAAVVVGDYAKGIVTNSLLSFLKENCRERGIWLSVDPKPIHQVDLAGMSLITPNRKEVFDLAGLADDSRSEEPLEDGPLLKSADRLLKRLKPALLLITLGDQGMLLCQKRKRPVHIPTVAREVFDVSGAGDTVIASFTLAIAAGASPIEAAHFSNQAGGIVVGKHGTATVSQKELIDSLNQG